MRLFPSRRRIMVLSGSSLVRYPSILNHTVYSRQHGYEYRFDAVPSQGMTSIYLHKVAIIRRNIVDADWIFWLDDDAFFRQLAVPLEVVAGDNFEKFDQIFCASPINNGAWTYLSSGNFFIRNCRNSRDLLDATLHTSMETARNWWNSEKYGMFTNGDQDLLVYQLENNMKYRSRAVILPYERFNTRPFHFEHSTSHFLVHFTHRPDVSKSDQMARFAQKFDLHASLVERERLSDFAEYAAQMV